MRLFAALLTFAGFILAQGPAEPTKIPFTCTPEDVEAFGLTCSPEEPCAVYMELAAIESVAGRIFLTGNLHSGVTTMFSILLASDDGGKTWTEPQARIRFGMLEQIQFVDLEYGWVGGAINQPLPRDPFLLLTTDAGKTWTRNSIFDDSHFGSVQQFWFNSRTEGQIVIDRELGGRTRHELFESNTGGSSWNPKEVSDKPVTLKRVRPPGDPVWRIRADAATKTYHIERRAADKWESVGSIAIRVGECQ